MPLGPMTSGTLSVNEPSSAAVPATFTMLSALWASKALRACVLPVIVAADALTVASGFGAVIVTFGGVWSST